MGLQFVGEGHIPTPLVHLLCYESRSAKYIVKSEVVSSLKAIAIPFESTTQTELDIGAVEFASDIAVVIGGEDIILLEPSGDIGRGFALWLMNKTSKKENIRVAVGRDSRLSGETLCGWICDAMVQQGLEITDFGMASTPAMFMSTVTEGYSFDGSVMITASHLPFNRNGFKFFTKDGGLEKQDISAILTNASGEDVTGLAPTALQKGEFMDDYNMYEKKYSV